MTPFDTPFGPSALGLAKPSPESHDPEDEIDADDANDNQLKGVADNDTVISWSSGSLFLVGITDTIGEDWFGI